MVTGMRENENFRSSVLSISQRFIDLDTVWSAFEACLSNEPHASFFSLILILINIQESNVAPRLEK